MTEATGEIVAEKTDDTKTVDTAAADAGKTQDGKVTDTAKTDDKAKADTGKEFVADSTKSDEENAAALAEWEKANPPAEKKDVKPGLPDDWREIAAAGDDDTLKMLKRYGSLSGVAKALVEAKSALRSGKAEKPMPDGSDEKALAEWRKEMGIPPDAAGYVLPDTVVKRLTDEDKPMLSSYTEYMHKRGATPAEVSRGTEWYIDTMDAIQAKQVEQDKSDKEKAEDALRKDMAHGEYRAQTTLARNWVDTIPGLGADVMGIRAPDGRLLGSIPEFVLWAAEQGAAKFGDMAFSTPDGERKHTARKEEIEKIRDTDFERYEREGLAKELIAIREREDKRRK